MKNYIEILESVQPPVPRDMRIALINAEIVSTHKEAQELYVAPFLARMSMINTEEVMVPKNHDRYFSKIPLKERRPYFGV